MELERDYFYGLPKDVWELMILSRLDLKDHIRIAAVCRASRAMLSEYLHHLHRLPWLLISQDSRAQTAKFLSLSEHKTYDLQLSLNAGIGYHGICGSSHGYLVMLHTSGDGFLYSPFHQTKIPLPAKNFPCYDLMFGSIRSDLKDHVYTKAIVLKPTSDDSQIVVAAICRQPNNILAMCRPQDNEWSVFGTEDKLLFSDILFYNGKLHGLTSNRLYCLELFDSEQLAFNILSMLPMKRPFHAKADHITNYLVESCGKLLVVYRHSKSIADRPRKLITQKFSVYELDESCALIRKQSLGDEVLFLGRNASISISSKGIPGVKGNCIYFTDDSYIYWSGHGMRYLDNGIFNLEDERIEMKSPPFDLCTDDVEPTWFTPSIKI